MYIQLIFSTFLLFQKNQTSTVDNMVTHESTNCQEMSEKIIVNEVEGLCDKLRLCSLVSETNEIKDDAGIVYFIFFYIFYYIICHY